MNDTVLLLGRLLDGFRILVFGVALVVAVLALLDWLVRTRKVNPFGGLARFVRRTVQPLWRPVEGRVVRAGGNPAHAPWWTLGAVAVLGIIVISILETLIREVAISAAAVRGGPGAVLALVVGWAFAVLNIALIVRVVSSWIRVSPYSPWLRWAYVLTEPILAPLRRVIPSFGGVDVTPIVAWLLIGILRGVVVGALR